MNTALKLVSYTGLALTVLPSFLVFGGMLSIQVAGGAQEATDVAARVKLFTRATSLGGVESLIEHRASVEGPASATSQNLLRISVGLEHVDDLLEDLDQALG